MKMLQVSKCFKIGLAVVMLQSCDVEENRRDLLCGNWESVEGRPDVPYLPGEGGSLQGDGVLPERSAPQAQTGNLSLAGGRTATFHEHRLPHRRVLHNEATDVLTFSPNGELCAGEAAAG